MTASDVRLYVRDRNCDRVGELDDVGSFECVGRVNDVGAWTLDLPAASQYAAFLDPDTSGGLAGIVLVVDGEPVFSGPVLQRRETATLTRFSGACDNHLYRRHLARPDNPDDTTLPISNVASQAMRSFVDAQIGPVGGHFLPERQIPMLTFPGDPGVGPTLELAIPSYTTMLSALQEMALRGGGLVFRTLQVTENDWSPGRIEFIVGEARDRRAEVLFSIASGTLEDFEHTRQTASANHVYAGSGAGGDGTTLAPVSDEFDAGSISRFGRVEAYLNLQRTTDEADIAQALAAALDEGSDRRAVKLTPIETANVAFGTGYQLGDLVRARVGSVTVDAVVREVTVKLDGRDGVTVTPTLGTPGTTNDPASTRLARAITDRVAVLERSTGSLAQVSALAAGLGLGAVPIGGVIAYAGQTSPDPSLLLCQGQALNSADYPVLFALLGTTFNTGGEGAGVFRIPDLRGRVVLMDSPAYTFGAAVGNTDVTPTYAGGVTKTGDSDESEAGPSAPTAGLVAADGHAHDLPAINPVSVLQPSLVLNYLIRVL